MHIFIDESGSFNPAGEMPSPSVVGALVLPDHNLADIERRYAKLRPKIWRKTGEVKGRELSEASVATVLDLLRRGGALLEVVVIEMGMHSPERLKAHQADLAVKLTKNLTPEHHENAHKWVGTLRDELEAMKLPGFVQSTMNFELLRSVFENASNYYAQRVPKEVGQYVWVVDGKEPLVDATPWEKWWTTVMLPYLQGQSLSRPGLFLAEADWTHYARFELEAIPEYLVPHVKPDGRNKKGSDIRKVFEDIRFSSDPEPGLELADIVTNALRRALVGNLGREGWIGIRDLMIARKEQSINMVSLNGFEPPPPLPYYDVLKEFKGHGRPFFAPRFREPNDPLPTFKPHLLKARE